MNYLKLFSVLLLVVQFTSCSKENRNSTSVKDIELNCNNYEIEGFNNYEETFQDLSIEDLNIDNVGKYHNILLNDFYNTQDYAEMSIEDISSHYENLVYIPDNLLSNDLNLDFVNYDFNNIDFGDEINFTELEMSFASKILSVIQSAETVDQTKLNMESVKIEIQGSAIAANRQSIFLIGADIAISSYKFWAPTDIGGDNNIHRINCELDRIDTRAGRWTTWLVEVVCADIVGGLAGAGRAAYLGPMGWLGAGLFGAGVSSTYTGIRNLP